MSEPPGRSRKGGPQRGKGGRGRRGTVAGDQDSAERDPHGAALNVWIEAGRIFDEIYRHTGSVREAGAAARAHIARADAADPHRARRDRTSAGPSRLDPAGAGRDSYVPAAFADRAAKAARRTAAAAGAAGAAADVAPGANVPDVAGHRAAGDATTTTTGAGAARQRRARSKRRVPTEKDRG